jgi:AraC family transcriptional regulator, transcriptional activator of pobA
MRRTRKNVPSFSLYGEQPTSPVGPDMVHIEDIPSRSGKYLGQIGSHRHLTLYQCIMVTAGPATVMIEDTQSTFDGPIAVIVPAGTIHGFRFRAETRGFVLTVDLAKLATITAPAHLAPIESLFATARTIDLRLCTGLSLRISSLLECLLHEFRQPERLAETVTGWLTCSVLRTVAVGATTAAASELHSSADLRLLREFRLLVERHYSAHWAIERYARELAVSETSLNRLCRRLTGNTGFDLLQQRLALEARRRLLYAVESVSTIAIDLGFTDSAYFSRFFRRHSGVAPAEFRRRHAGGKVPTGTRLVQ